MRIKKIGVVSLAKTFGVVYGLMGILIGAIFSLVSLVGAGALASEELGAAGVSALFGIGAIILFPILYGILGFIGGLLMGFFFNIATGISGGLEFEVDMK